MTLDPKLAAMFEVDVLRSANAEERTRICFFNKRGYKYREPFPDDVRSNLVMSTILSNPVRYESVITIDTSRASTLPDALSRPPESAPVLIEPDEPVRLRVFVDRSVVEVFVNDRQYVAARVYPGARTARASRCGPRPGFGAALARLLADEKRLRMTAGRQIPDRHRIRTNRPPGRAARDPSCAGAAVTGAKQVNEGRRAQATA